MTRLTIDGVSFRIDGQKLALSYDADSLADVESGRSAQTVTVVLHSSPEADRLFAGADNPLSARRFNASEHRATIEADGVELFRGTAFLAEATLRGGCSLYKLEIRGDTALWARAAALRKLSAASVEFSGRLTAEDICAGWSDQRPVKFFPVNRTARQLTNSSVSLLPAQTVMTTDDYHPFISVAALTKAIFEDAGYTVRSRFMESELFRSLYISGSYESVDAAAQKLKYDFRAGRTADAEAAADYFGRVYMNAVVGTNSVGNIVDTVESIVTDENGKTTASGLFSANDCFFVDEQTGIATFRPTSETVAGFEYSIAYVTDHRIVSRERLKGFDTVYLGYGIRIPFTLENRYVDNRQKPLPGYAYKVMIFDFDASYRYRLTGTLDGKTVTLLDNISAAMTALSMPSGDALSDLRLLRTPKNTTRYTACSEDWALYWGYITETGQTEVEIKVCSPAEKISPSSGKQFNELFIEGAESGMKFKLLKRTTVRPLFSAAAGYGSQLEFGDVCAADVRQSELLEALQQMFDLRFCTDEPSKTVSIEPYGDFFTGGIVDRSGRVDRDSDVVITDPSQLMHEALTLGYGEDDGAVTRFNNRTGERFGRWTFRPDSTAALDGEKTILNPLFSPTVSETDKYFEARSAAIMQVRDTDELSDDTTTGNFSMRIVRYAGLQPLAEGEVWASPAGGNSYPLAAFHFEGNDRTEGFTLCFEDRDGIEGLNRFHRRRLEEQSQGARVTLALHMLPEEFAALSRTDEAADDMPTARSRYILDADGRSRAALYTLHSAEGYEPDAPVVKCTFTKCLETL